MKSTSGLSICPKNWRAYADKDSTYLRCPSAKIVSKARLDFPEPDKPVKTIKDSRGSSMETSLRLCSRAPRTISLSMLINAPLLASHEVLSLDREFHHAIWLLIQKKVLLPHFSSGQ